MTDTNTLAPCPFCGERAETDFIPEHHSYQIACSDSIGCTARITRDSELGAIEAWNCRAALAAPAQPVAWPRNAAEVREFMDAHCQREERANDDSSPSDDDLYALTAYNFLSAVNSWADSPHHPGATQPAAQAQLEDVATPVQPLHVAAINCPHEIDKDKIVLHFDSKQPGKNALAQLAARLQAAQAQHVHWVTPTIAQMKEYCKQASAMMARDLTRFDAACEVMGYLKEMRAPGYYMHRMNIVLHGNVEGTDAARASDKAAQPAAKPAAQAQAAPVDAAKLTQAVRDVLSERQRQISAEGWTPEKGGR